MARDAITVEDVGPFETPTPSAGVDIYNSGDGKFWVEKPGHPATIALFNNGGALRTITVTAAPNAPGSPANWTGDLSNGSLVVFPPGFFPAHLFRRDDDQETDPGCIYIDASGNNVMAVVVRGPPQAGARTAGAGDEDSSRTKITPTEVVPIDAIPQSALSLDDSNGNILLANGREAWVFKRSASYTVTFGVNPNNRFGQSSDVAVSGTANQLTVFPPGVPHLDLMRRNHSTDKGLTHIDASAASIDFACARMASLQVRG